jgi:cytochrome P450
MIAGKKLCRDEEFLQTTYRFTGTLLPSAVWTNFLNLGPLDFCVAKYTTWFHRRELEASIKLLTPTIIQRLRAQSEGDLKAVEDDSIQWAIEEAIAMKNPQELQPRRVAENVLHLLFAANSAPGALVTQMVFQVLMCPEYLEPLRQEIDSAIGQENHWTAAVLEKMPLLDSFVRETLRLYPPGASK